MRLSLETNAMSPEMRVFLTAGFCGGFTTFSTFSYDALALFETGAYRAAFAYVLGSVALSLVGAVVGVALAQQLGTLLRAHGASS